VKITYIKLTTYAIIGVILGVIVISLFPFYHFGFQEKALTASTTSSFETESTGGKRTSIPSISSPLTVQKPTECSKSTFTQTATSQYPELTDFLEILIIPLVFSLIVLYLSRKLIS